MEKIEFNLIDEPWIRVNRLDGEREMVSLKDALLRAHEFSGLAGEMPTQDVAILRTLLAVTMTFFYRVNEVGEPAPLETEDDALERWDALWANRIFPPQPIIDYLNKWHERFWLFHPERPFMQAISAANGTDCGTPKLIGEISESGSKPRLFACRAGEGKEKIPYDEAARWLVSLNGFDDAALKPHIPKDQREATITVAWLGKLGLVYAKGETLFETLMLNLTLLKDGREPWPEPTPDWELEEPRSLELRKIPLPAEPAALYTFHPRLILLKRAKGFVTGYSILCGDTFDGQNAFTEQMTVWRYVPAKKEQAAYFYPLAHFADRQMWRDIGVFYNTSETSKRPGVVEWICTLQEKGIISSDDIIQFVRVGNRYDISMKSCVTDVITSNLLFHSSLLKKMNDAWRNRIMDELGKCEEMAFRVGLLAGNLYVAGGGSTSNTSGPADLAKEQWYFNLSEPFTQWLMSIDPEKDDIDVKTEEWHQQLKKIAFSLGDELVFDAPPKALFGRTVNVKSGSKIKQQHYSASEALAWFKAFLFKTYPKKEENS